MRINISEFIAQTGLNEPFYPGKRLVKACPQPGEFKCHCVVYDWRDPSKIRVEVRAGLTGAELSRADLAKYPVSFQAPTFIEIDVASGNVTERRKETEEEEETGKGKASSGGKGLKKKSLSLASFSEAVRGAIPELGEVAKMVVMGMEIAKDAYGQVLESFADHVQKGKMVASDLLAQAGKLVTRYTPPAFMKPAGNETASYQYDRVKNEVMFGMGL